MNDVRDILEVDFGGTGNNGRKYGKPGPKMKKVIILENM